MESGLPRLSESVHVYGIRPVVDVEQFLAGSRVRLERALVARFGLDDVLEAADEAAAYAVEHWGRLSMMANPAGYLFRVGQTYGGRTRRRWQSTELLSDVSAVTSDVFDIDLQRSLMRLKPAEWITVMLIHGHGHTYAEVAELLDVPITTIANNLSRGLVRLRHTLETT